MSISEPFIRRPVGTTLLALGLLIMGIVAYEFLPVASMPRVDSPVISISAQLPGADPATMASSVAAPLEKHLGHIAGVNEMTSVSSLGAASVTLQFDLNRNIDGAARDVQAAISAAANDLPIDLPGPPTYRKVNPADAPIMIMAMTSATLPLSRIYEYANDIVAQKISQIEGVSQAIVGGGAKSAVRVQINPAALASTGLGLEDVRNMIGQVNVDLPKGSVDSDRSFAITSNDQLTNAEDYQSLLLMQSNNVPIQLRALGQVVEGVENNQQAGWDGTNRAVLLIIFKQPGANVIETVERVKANMPMIEKWIPPAIKIRPLSDRTITIRASVKDVEFSLMTSIILVVLVIFLFLRRFWPTFIASVTVPLALAGTFGAMYLLNYTVDNLSLMAITICVGFVVDDAIVVIENVFRFIEHGDPPMDAAALKGARQIGFTVVSMSLSLVAVFIPLLFMGGLVGRTFHEFAMTLTMAIVVSGIISLTLTPMLCSRFLKADRGLSGAGSFLSDMRGRF